MTETAETSIVSKDGSRDVVLQQGPGKKLSSDGRTVMESVEHMLSLHAQPPQFCFII